MDEGNKSYLKASETDLWFVLESKAVIRFKGGILEKYFHKKVFPFPNIFVTIYNYFCDNLQIFLQLVPNQLWSSEYFFTVWLQLFYDMVADYFVSS